MDLFKKLEKNKGTVSSKLGKEIALQAIKGETDLIAQSAELCVYKLEENQYKNIRAGAAKILQMTAEKKPELVKPYLKKILPAFDVKEPQTRWMLILILGSCIGYSPDLAETGINYAEKFIKEQNGVCLSGAAEKTLGQIGALSDELAVRAADILIKAMENPLPNELDWILEGLLKITDRMTMKQKQTVLKHLDQYPTMSAKKITQKRIEKLSIKLRKANV